ncbi:hypothetical protein CSUI_010736, partial [Cystoisospora suis]
MQRLKKKAAGPITAGTFGGAGGFLSGSKQRNEEYSLSYEAYRHFAFFCGLYLHAVQKAVPAREMVNWYLKEKSYCVPPDIPKALINRVYSRLVNNLVVDNCVTVECVNDEGMLWLQDGKMFPLWAWKEEVLEYDRKLQGIGGH